ncbi:head to tail connecting protein [Vibrio phage 1.182.O._10N.286.46.E1]|nr:head to tail connecting protein [Vibrio phage 1.182.O._10N.286.46.E1]
MDYKQLTSSLTKYRGNWDVFWQQVAERCITDQADFNVTRAPGTQRGQRIYDSTTAMAINRSAAAIVGLITPKSERWHALKTDNDAVNDSQNVKRYFEDVTNILFSLRYSARSGFSPSNYQTIRSLMGFGTGALTANESPTGRGIIYQSLFLGDMYFGVDNFGVIDTAMREFQFTKAQAIQQWGEDKLPRKIMQDKGDTKFTFCHVVHANPDYDEFSMNPDKRKFKFVYIFKDDMDNTLDQGGYYTFPYAVAREQTSPNEIYGRSPAMQILPEIKGLNEMRKTNIMAGHMSVTPPLLAPSAAQGAGVLGAGPMSINFKPGGVTHGGVNAQGQQMIQPMNTGARPDIGQGMIEESRRMINDSFYLNLFQILVESPQMTATEVLARTQEKGILLAPTADRLEQEYLGPLIERELDIAQRQGLLPELPGELVEAEGEFSIVYESPITRAQRAGALMGMDDTVQSAMNVAAYDPSVLDRINLDEYIKSKAEVNGTPPSIVRSDSETDELRKGREAAQQQQQLLEQAPALAGAARDLAQAQAMGD